MICVVVQEISLLAVEERVGRIITVVGVRWRKRASGVRTDLRMGLEEWVVEDSIACVSQFSSLLSPIWLPARSPKILLKYVDDLSVSVWQVFLPFVPPNSIFGWNVSLFGVL